MYKPVVRAIVDNLQKGEWKDYTPESEDIDFIEEAVVAFEEFCEVLSENNVGNATDIEDFLSPREFRELAVTLRIYNIAEIQCMFDATGYTVQLSLTESGETMVSILYPDMAEFPFTLDSKGFYIFQFELVENLEDVEDGDEDEDIDDEWLDTLYKAWRIVNTFN